MTVSEIRTPAPTQPPPVPLVDVVVTPVVAPAPAPLDPAPATAVAPAVAPATPAEPEDEGGSASSQSKTTFPSHLKFTPEQQAFFNERVADARNKGRESSRTYTLRELGIGTLDEGKTLLANARAAQTTADQTVAQLRTDVSQLQSRIENDADQWRSKVTAAEHQRDLAHQEAIDTLRLTRVQLVAARLGFRKPEDDPARFLNLNALMVDLSGKTVTGVEEALQQLAEDRPYLLVEKQEPIPAAVPADAVPPPAPEPVVTPPPVQAAPVPEPVTEPPPPLPPTPSSRRRERKRNYPEDRKRDSSGTRATAWRG